MDEQHVRLITAPTGGDFPGIPFKQARFYRAGRRGFEPCWIVLHTAECSETLTGAEALQTYAAKMDDGREASWHFAVDADSVTQSVKLADSAWQAPPLNDCSVGIETAGFARQVDSDWKDAYSSRLLAQQLIPFIARVAMVTGIPIQTVADDRLEAALPTASALAARKHTDADDWLGFKSLCGGVVTHAQVARVFKKTTHYDPGPYFPLATVVAGATFALDAMKNAAPQK